MIPFFRKIRKKMADDNKPLKYMRYAIGEIVLVVIGILIALSINNWNENRKAIIIEKDLYKRTLITLDHEQASLVELLTDFNKTLYAYNHIYNETQGKVSRDTVNAIYNNLKYPMILDLVVSDMLDAETKITNAHILELINQKYKVEDRLNFVLAGYNNYKTDIVNPYLEKKGVFNTEKAFSQKNIGFYKFIKLDLVNYDKLVILYPTVELNQILFALKSKSIYIHVQLERLINKNNELKIVLEEAIN